MQFKVHNEFPQNLEASWNNLLAESTANLPFLRYEYLKGWWQNRGGGEWPASESELAIITAEKDGQLIGIAPFFFAKNRQGVPALLFLGSIEISDYLDLIVRPNDLTEFTTGLIKFLQAGYPQAWQQIDLYNLAENAASLMALENAAIQAGWQVKQEALEAVPSIPLPGDFEAYLASIDKKQRHEIRRKMRRAEESGRSLRWYIATDESQLDDEIEAFFNLMANDPAKAEFLTEIMRAQMKQTMQAAFKNGWLQLAFLEVDGKKACAYLNFDYNNKIWVYNSGLNREFLELSVGWVLLGYLLQWANENQRTEFDFMRGDEDYKYKFGGQPGRVQRLILEK